MEKFRDLSFVYHFISFIKEVRNCEFRVCGEHMCFSDVKCNVANNNGLHLSV